MLSILWGAGHPALQPLPAVPRLSTVREAPHARAARAPPAFALAVNSRWPRLRTHSCYIPARACVTVPRVGASSSKPACTCTHVHMHTCTVFSSSSKPAAMHVCACARVFMRMHLPCTCARSRIHASKVAACRGAGGAMANCSEASSLVHDWSPGHCPSAKEAGGRGARPPDRASGPLSTRPGEHRVEAPPDIHVHAHIYANVI